MNQSEGEVFFRQVWQCPICHETADSVERLEKDRHRRPVWGLDLQVGGIYGFEHSDYSTGNYSGFMVAGKKSPLFTHETDYNIIAFRYNPEKRLWIQFHEPLIPRFIGDSKFMGRVIEFPENHFSVMMSTSLPEYLITKSFSTKAVEIQRGILKQIPRG